MDSWSVAWEGVTHINFYNRSSLVKKTIGYNIIFSVWYILLYA